MLFVYSGVFTNLTITTLFFFLTASNPSCIFRPVCSMPVTVYPGLIMIITIVDFTVCSSQAREEDTVLKEILEGLCYTSISVSNIFQ